MKVILQKDIKKLGAKGDIVEVSTGYARNYLLVNGFADEATEKKLKRNAQLKKTIQDKIDQKIKKIKELIETLPNSLQLFEKANEKGHLFRTLTKDVVKEGIKKQFSIDIDAIDFEIIGSTKEIGKKNLVFNYDNINKSIELEVCKNGTDNK